MKNEREIAELIFDIFRNAKCREGQGVMMRTIYFSVARNLNPIEQDKYGAVINGIINLKYVDYIDQPEFLKLTKKGFNYIYDDQKIKEIQETPWLLPPYNNVDWQDAFSKLASVLNNPYWHQYLSADKFWEIVQSLDNTIISHQDFIDGINKDEIGLYHEIIDKLDKDKKFVLYLNLQYLCETAVFGK